MLSQLHALSYKTDGRYATDEELQVVDDFARSFLLRAQTYQQLKAAEGQIVQQVYAKIRTYAPELFLSGDADVSAKWKRDTIRVLRYSAIAMLLNDPDSLRERLLFWMRTIMKAFGAERSCNATYQIMQEVIKQHLSPSQANLICPILEMNRQILGAA
ncbi:MAG: phycobilisome protein [Leptolyngbyaceae cyanobacterium bins.302]|nr:phycobilisome protein [Leptolyngbyaceae cyanobacterium bins.302]